MPNGSKRTARDWSWGGVPPGFKKVTDGRGGLMLIREDVEAFLTLEECTIPNDQDENHPVAFQGRGELRTLRLRNHDTALVRCYRHGGLFRNLLGESFFTWPPRPFRELAITEEVRRRGIPTVEVYAACVKRTWGPFYRGWLVTRHLTDSRDLWEAIRDGFIRNIGIKKILAAVAQSLRGLHREGVYHRDLNLKNILVRRESDQHVRAYIIDFDRAALFLGEVPMTLVQKNLYRLLRSANKLDSQKEYFSDDDWESFVKSYHKQNANEP
jgi:tRNA A-37 threonylcarbamoyl transferase component Bud32